MIDRKLKILRHAIFFIFPSVLGRSLLICWPLEDYFFSSEQKKKSIFSFPWGDFGRQLNENLFYWIQAIEPSTSTVCADCESYIDEHWIKRSQAHSLQTLVLVLVEREGKGRLPNKVVCCYVAHGCELWAITLSTFDERLIANPIYSLFLLHIYWWAAVNRDHANMCLRSKRKMA